jgi:hypothetical protein
VHRNDIEANAPRPVFGGTEQYLSDPARAHTLVDDQAVNLDATAGFDASEQESSDPTRDLAFGKLSNENGALVRVLHIPEPLSNFFPCTFVAELSRQVGHRFAIARLSGTNGTRRLHRHDIGLLFHPSKLLRFGTPPNDRGIFKRTCPTWGLMRPPAAWHAWL